MASNKKVLIPTVLVIIVFVLFIATFILMMDISFNKFYILTTLPPIAAILFLLFGFIISKDKK